jgi:hypothetical protein
MRGLDPRIQEPKFPVYAVTIVHWRMDGRVKPGHDATESALPKSVAPSLGSHQADTNHGAPDAAGSSPRSRQPQKEFDQTEQFAPRKVELARSGGGQVCPPIFLART